MSFFQNAFKIEFLHVTSPFTFPQKMILDFLVTRKMIPNATLGLLYTNISQLILHATAAYVTAYLAIMLPSLLALQIQTVTYIIIYSVTLSPNFVKIGSQKKP